MEKYSELLQILLKKIGILDKEKAEAFLNPNYERDMHDPFLMKDMECSCVRIFEAIEAKEKIIIYSDYDADGIPGAVILQDLFKKINFKNFEVYIPQRNSEGYGLSIDAIKEFINKNVKLLITIDLGITAIEEVAQAESNGIDVIITDHHLSQKNIPRAYAILNPKIDNYPEKMLCGAGVVFKLIQGFIKKYGEFYKINEGWEKWALDMVALATLSDMVPLVGENRVISYFGMTVLKKTHRLGLQKLLSKMNIDKRYITEDDIGFMVTPKLNAASRMDDPIRAYELLSTDDEIEAGNLVNHLLKINDNRKVVVAGIVREVKRNFEKREMRDVIVIGNPSWRIGVLGLVAGKIADEYEKPVFVWGRDENNLIKGSCRSDGSVSVVELMTAATDHFIEFGGHELAGGFTVYDEKIHLLEETLSNFYEKIKTNKNETEIEEFILRKDLSFVNMKNYKEVEKLAPFGLENPKPVFRFNSLNIEKIKKFGKNGSGEHLEIIFSDSSGNKKNGISFFSSTDSFSAPLEENKKVDLFATLDLSRFKGKEELRLRIVDITG
ncbi:MAG TPA: single-stranded-DNA-specific exonuclease RecJ [Candidatus Paceibacterota bacterium]|nr:single-stranded-DNA-specific exonuclease RecJ [Candidatus Paceibacterota bacterium]HPT18063.1 single-stranded-DNA-specific exonuclease RecJ [Candidatus Paceibacterota bacterium]